MQDEIDEVLRLVAQPLRNRHKLLSGECKFVLNSTILFQINKVLDIFVSDSVDIILSDEKRKKLQLLLNLFSNVPKLCVTQRSAESFENVINLSKFKRLRHLELKRVCLQLVAGLDSLKTQLESFICSRCTKHANILSKKKELEWPELKYYNLSYMKLDSTSSGLFMNKPWIQVLDLSCNRLNSISGIDCLEHLVYLNVSFNYLEALPVLSKDSEKRLEYLKINNNYLNALSGIEKLTSLRHVDVNYNFVSNKEEFKLFSGLSKLRSLNFAHNPVSNIKYSGIYLAASLSPAVNRNEFLLNERPLNNLEYNVFGKKFGACKHSQRPGNDGLPTLTELPPDPRSQYRRPGKRISKPRNVIIEELPSDVPETNLPESSSQKGSSLPKPSFSASAALQNTSDKENELMEQLNQLGVKAGTSPERIATASTVESKEDGIGKNFEVTEHSADMKLCQEPPSFLDSDSETTTLLINATVHAPDTSSVDLISTTDENIETQINEVSEEEEEILSRNQEETSSDSDNLKENVSINEILNLNETLSAQNTLNNAQNEKNRPIQKIIEITNKQNTRSFLNDDNYDIISDKFLGNDEEKNILPTDESDEVCSDIDDEEFWQVQSVDKITGKKRNIILVLLENELKERSTETGRTITRWDLRKIQSCTKTKIDPVTIEMEFDTLKKDKQLRTYIMEFPDAQVLLKKVYMILESRPLSLMNQKTYECIKCGSFFVRSKPSAFKSRDSTVNCTVCSSTLVIEVEEPKLPEPPPAPVSHSSSQSSIGCGSIKTEEAACTKWIMQPCSAASLDPSNTPDRRLSTQKYESDIEVISNPSQSSIEVLGDHSRSVTPRRKISSEEKTGPPPLSTVPEVSSPFANLTESSSSGSLTESVVTAYEAINNNLKSSIIPEGILAEEVTASPLTEELEPITDGFEEERPVSVWKMETEIYSYSDFTDVDPRIKLYLYQNLFQDDNETLLLFVKCHLWRTGGSDYDGCAVFTTSKVYFLSHSKTNFKEDICDWLSLFDSFDIKNIKEISPLIWDQGVRVQMKQFSYLILLMDKERTASLLKHMRGFLTDIKIRSILSTSAELPLQQAVLATSSIEKCADPTVMSFNICLSISIHRDDVLSEILRLGSLITTSGEFHVLPGDLTWITCSAVPSIVASQDMSNLIEVEKGKCSVNLHFLDEKEAIEEIWQLKLASDFQVASIIDSIRLPWEQMFSESLEVTLRS